MDSEKTTNEDKVAKVVMISKKIFYAIIIGTFLILIGTLIGIRLEEKRVENQLYPTVGEVIRLDYKTDIVTVEVYGGFQYQFYGCEDWNVGDFCSMIMDSRKTGLIYDDEIVKVYYENIPDSEVAQ